MDKKVKQFAIIQVLLVMIFSLFACNLANRQSVLQTLSFVTTKSTSVTVTPKITATPCPSIALPSATTAETNLPDATPDEPTVTVRLTPYSPPPAPDQKFLAPFDSALAPLHIGTAATEDKDFIYYNLDNVIHKFNKATMDDVPIRASTGTIQELFIFHGDLLYVVQDFAYTSDGAPIEDDQGRYKTTDTLYRYVDQNLDEIVLKGIGGIYRIDNQFIYYDTDSDLRIFDFVHNKLVYRRNNSFKPNEYLYSWYSLNSYSVIEYLSQKIQITDCINGKRVKSYSFPYSVISAGDGLNIVEFKNKRNRTAFKIVSTRGKTAKSLMLAKEIPNIQFAYLHGITLYLFSVDTEKYKSVLYGVSLDRRAIAYTHTVDGLISATVAQDGMWYYYMEKLDDDGLTSYVCRFNTADQTHTVMNPHEEIGNSVNDLELCGGYIFGFEENWIDLENYRFEFMLPVN